MVPLASSASLGSRLTTAFKTADLCQAQAAKVPFDLYDKMAVVVVVVVVAAA